ncbi:hypothetical protein KUW17_22450 [Leisingera aquaemixtae]|uniref:hypothetical protein n=1 Tax=Leisingera aquaemixtae TaxID=1396826 RepID=UPI001C97D96F|nr:hypothetical protein [Leisingera aquaemixtae]MBY6069515.1 hypothetical protein [Leisingera aquaemixtae]
MNVLVNPPRIQAAVRESALTALIPSPLAMGLLTGKYGPDIQTFRETLHIARDKTIRASETSDSLQPILSKAS